MAPRASTSTRVVGNTSKNAKAARSARDSSTSTRGGKKVAIEEEEEEFEEEEEGEDGVTETQAEMAAVLQAFKSMDKKTGAHVKAASKKLDDLLKENEDKVSQMVTARMAALDKVIKKSHDFDQANQESPLDADHYETRLEQQKEAQNKALGALDEHVDYLRSTHDARKEMKNDLKRRPDEIKRAVKRMNKGVKSQAAESARVCEQNHQARLLIVKSMRGAIRGAASTV